MKSRLKVVLAEKRITQRELARELKVSKDTVWRWTTDKGITRVPFGRAVSIAKALGCQLTDLYEE